MEHLKPGGVPVLLQNKVVSNDGILYSSYHLRSLPFNRTSGCNATKL